MFETLQESLDSALKSFPGKANLTESNMRDGLDSIRQALLEAEVSVAVVNDFIDRVAEKAVGEQVPKSLNSSELMIGIVHHELIELMGPVDHSLHLKDDVSVLMLCGLRGSGKTTTCGKLAKLIAKRGKQPLMVAADLQRPAAIDQLHALGKQIGLPVFSQPNAKDPVELCQNAVKHAETTGADVVILDTAGHIHFDDELMAELLQIDRRIRPQQVFHVVDGTMGQDAVRIAQEFSGALELDGFIFTKMDGDARGGAVLSVNTDTGVPVKFIGVGERLDALEEFHPDRIVCRILGLGDVLTLIPQAKMEPYPQIPHVKAVFNQRALSAQLQRLRDGQFTLEDFNKMLLQTMSSLKMTMDEIMEKIPDMESMKEEIEGAIDETALRRLGGIIDSMTKEERRDPMTIIDQSRRRRIAAGAGVEPHDVNDIVKGFDEMVRAMKDEI